MTKPEDLSLIFAEHGASASVEDMKKDLSRIFAEHGASVEDVRIKPISPEEELLREVHEEPRHEIVFEFTVRPAHPLKYIGASFVIDPKNL